MNFTIGQTVTISYRNVDWDEDTAHWTYLDRKDEGEIVAFAYKETGFGLPIDVKSISTTDSSVVIAVHRGPRKGDWALFHLDNEMGWITEEFPGADYAFID